VIRLEADVKHTVAKPKTIAEALDELESKVGKDGRKKFEKFLRSAGAAPRLPVNRPCQSIDA
jgi:hypothetical protein